MKHEELDYAVPIYQCPDFSLRVQPNLRAEIIRQAKEKGVSQNKFLTEILTDVLIKKSKVQ